MPLEFDENTGIVTGAAQRALVEKCQENGWIRDNGFAWQDDPFLEQYPYCFKVVESVEELHTAFALGNWSIRQGFVYDDLAFIQQVDAGDEWWTLKLNGNGSKASDWVAFESCSFGQFTRDVADNAPARFTNLIRSMQMASIEQCSKREYSLSAKSPTWGFWKAETIVPEDGFSRRCFTADAEGYELKVAISTSSGITNEITDKATGRVLASGPAFGSALDAANDALKKLRFCERHDIHTPETLRDCIPLEIKASAASLISKKTCPPGRHVKDEILDY